MWKLFPAFDDKNIQIKHDTLVSFALFLLVQSFFTGYSTFNVGSNKVVFIATTLISTLVPIAVILFARKNYRMVSVVFILFVWLTTTGTLFVFDSDNSGLAYIMADLFIKSALASLAIRWYAGIIFLVATIFVGVLDQVFEKHQILNFLEVAPIPPMAYMVGFIIMLGVIVIIAAANAFSFENIYSAYQSELTKRKNAEALLKEHNLYLDRKVKERTFEIEALNQELKMVNSYLHQTNAELALKNEVLSSTLEKLKVTQDQLIQSEKMASLGVLASGIAHEINNPLNYIASGIFSLKKYLEKKYGGKEEELERILQVLNSGLHRSSTIITNLNRYSRKDDTAWSKCNIHEIVESCLLMLQNQTKYRIEIKQETEGHAYELICNEGKIHQAILNILSNAVQSIEGKGIVTIKTELERSMLCVSITDNGCGIKEEHLSKIFDPFFTTKEPGKGTGLGLSITYNIMKEHDGSIEYHSEHGKGTNVILKLPVAVTGNSI